MFFGLGALFIGLFFDVSANKRPDKNAGPIHPLHISICEMVYDKDRKALEITQRIFIDDLENHIRTTKKEPELNLLKPGKGRTTDELIKEYLSLHLKISLEGKDQNFEYIGHEVDGFAMYCYVQILGVRKVQDVKIKNDILLSMFEDQVNIIHVEVDNEIKSLKLHRGVKEGALKF